MQEVEGFYGSYMQFLQDNGVLGLALGMLIGGNLTTLAKAFIDGIIMPTLQPLIDHLVLLSGSKDLNVSWAGLNIKLGEFINQLIKFLVITLVIVVFLNYFGIQVKKPVQWVKVTNWPAGGV